MNQQQLRNWITNEKAKAFDLIVHSRDISPENFQKLTGYKSFEEMAASVVLKTKEIIEDVLKKHGL